LSFVAIGRLNYLFVSFWVHTDLLQRSPCHLHHSVFNSVDFTPSLPTSFLTSIFHVNVDGPPRFYFSTCSARESLWKRSGGYRHFTCSSPSQQCQIYCREEEHPAMCKKIPTPAVFKGYHKETLQAPGLACHEYRIRLW